MPGRDNWHGSGFHADIVTQRVLADLIALRDAERARLPAPTPRDYWIEHAAGTYGPDWDVVERRGAIRILEELKSGKVSAEERRAIWVRVRRTVSPDTPVQDVVVRLTADRDTIQIKKAWAGLSTCSEIPRTAPSKPPRRVDSAQQLFKEALAYLTHQDLQFRGAKKRKQRRGIADVGPPLSLPDAVTVLQRFEFLADRSRSEVQTEITTALQSLRSKTTATVLQTWLLGHFFLTAQQSGSIQATQLANALPLIQSILHLEPDLDRLLERVLEADPAKPQMKNLKLRAWRVAQPAAAAAIDSMANSSGAGFLVLTGEAGIGKSTVLVEVFQELKKLGHDVAWLSLGYDGGPPPTAAQLDQLTRLLAQRGAWTGRPCWLLVDGVDGLPDSLHCLTPHGDLRVIVAARTETYERRRQFSATQVALTRWPPGEIENIIGTKLPLDLATLLGNPFLLDLALEIPSAHLRRPSRFSVLSRYLSEIVFVPGVDGVSTRESYDVMARGLARGEHWTTPPAKGLQLLLDRSVAIAPGGGRVQFAHPLFGEFAIATWASHRTARLAIRRLSRIRDSFTRGSALKMLFEGCLDVTDSSRLLDLPSIASLIDVGLDSSIDIVGALASLDVGAPQVLQHNRASEFCARLFEAAALIDQRAWLRALVLLDLSPVPSWATAKSRNDALPLIADHLVACAKDLEVDTGQQVAMRLREWSRDQQSIWVSYLVGAIGIFLPDNETLRWMKSLITSDAPWYGASLRSGLRRVCSRGSKLDEALVQEVLERIVSFGTIPGFERFEDADGLLLGDDSDRGLLKTQPSIALNFLFDWQEQATADDKNDRMRRRQDVSEFGQLEPTIEEDEDDDE